MQKLRRILVVDSSRVVRATLAKHLKEDFTIREETNAESAWQTLVLDSSIVAVIASEYTQNTLNTPNTPKPGEPELLQRLRANPLRRLNTLPFLLIASDTGRHAEKDADNGIAGFISKTMHKDEIIARLRTALAPQPSTDAPAPPAPDDVPGKPPTLLSRAAIEQWIGHALASADDQPNAVCALMFGIVNHDGLSAQFGQEVATEIGARFAQLLLGKIGPQDAIARYGNERLVIITHGLELKQCAHFARRVCQSLASGQITVRGQKIKLTATAGAASSRETGITSSQDLLTLASQRLDRALACGSNAVVIDSQPECPLHHAGLLLPAMLAALSANDEQAITARIGTFGLQILPLLKALNQELALGLSLPEIERQLQQRAQAENGAKNGTKNGTASSVQTL